MPPPLLMDPSSLDLRDPVADRAAIEKVNPQRYEMQHLDAIVMLDPERKMIAGYKDVRRDEFWVRGHFPKYPLMPGVIMCEAAAQMVSYYSVTQGIVEEGLLGFGGMEEVRFRGPVRPGDRLVLIGQGKRLRRIQTIFNVQGFVGQDMVFHGDIIGVPLGQLGE